MANCDFVLLGVILVTTTTVYSSNSSCVHADFQKHHVLHLAF